MLSQLQIESDIKTVNEMVRICIECGSAGVNGNNDVVLCKNCNSKFKVIFKKRGDVHV